MLCSYGRQLSAIFLVLPTRKDLPDYYQKIAKPIDFRKMKVSTQPCIFVFSNYFVCACVCACARMRVCVCVCMYVRGYMCVCMCMHLSVRPSVRLSVCLSLQYMILLQDNITKHRYHSIDELEADILLLCQNTHTYNVEGSQVKVLLL